MGLSAEALSRYEAPFIPFPENPKLIKIGRHFAYDYINSGKFINQLGIFCKMFDFSKFDAIVYNENGGLYPSQLIKAFTGSFGEIIPVEYHNPKYGNTSGAVKRIPEELRDSKLLVIEDVFDEGVSYELMLKDNPNLWMIVMSLKVDVANQVKPDRVIPLFRTVNQWQAGAGMNMNYSGDPFYAEGAIREYPGIVVRPPDEVLVSATNS